MQSYLESRIAPPGGREKAFSPLFVNGQLARARQKRTLVAYCIACLLSALIHFASRDPAVQAFALGLCFPGAGFLHWAGPGSATQVLALVYAFASVGMPEMPDFDILSALCSTPEARHRYRMSKAFKQLLRA